MSIGLPELSERQLWLGLSKIVFSLTAMLLICAFLMTLLIDQGGSFSTVTINALLLSIAVSFLANGVLTILRILDWFQARRSKPHG